MSETTITAVVRDMEGRRYGDEAVTWSHDLGTVISADAMTNAIGETRLVLQAPTSNGTATISATAGGATSQCFSEFATADAPSVRITQLVTGATVSGDVHIVVTASDSVGLNPGVMCVSVSVDGTELDTAPDWYCDSWLRSYRLPNGAHQITATAMDWDGNVSNSNLVTITTQNDIAAFSLTPDTVAPNQPVHISGQVTVAPGWSVTVTDPSNNQLLWSTSGTGSTISADWQGTSQGGIYTVTATATATGKTASDAAVNNTTTNPQFLIVNAHKTPGLDAMILKLKAIAVRRQLSYKVLSGAQATWDSIKTALSGTACRYLFIQTHGQCSGKVGGQITRLLLGDNSELYAKSFSYVKDGQVIQVCEGDPDPNMSVEPSHKVHYVASVNRNFDLSPLKFVWNNACYGGQIGATTRKLDGSRDYQSGQYAEFSCYQTSGWNDMATALGITALRAQESGLGYVGWYEMAINDNPAYVGDSTKNGMIIDAFGQLAAGNPGQGYSFEFARNWIWNNSPSYRFDDVVWEDPSEDPPVKLRVIAPYYNWRFFGNNAVRLF